MTHNAEKVAPPRRPRPCPECGRTGLCADCCCVHPSHGRRWPSPAACPLCKHATRVVPPPGPTLCTCTRWDYAKDPNSPDEHLWEPGEGKCPDTRPLPPGEDH